MGRCSRLVAPLLAVTALAGCGGTRHTSPAPPPDFTVSQVKHVFASVGLPLVFDHVAGHAISLVHASFCCAEDDVDVTVWPSSGAHQAVIVVIASDHKLSQVRNVVVEYPRREALRARRAIALLKR